MYVYPGENRSPVPFTSMKLHHYAVESVQATISNPPHNLACFSYIFAVLIQSNIYKDKTGRSDLLLVHLIITENQIMEKIHGSEKNRISSSCFRML